MKQCAICDKKRNLAKRLNKLRGKFNPTKINRKQKPNFQWTYIPVGIKKAMFKDFIGKRVLLCTKCMKAMGKLK